MTFYKELLERYSDDDFIRAGYPEWTATYQHVPCCRSKRRRGLRVRLVFPPRTSTHLLTSPAFSRRSGSPPAAHNLSRPRTTSPPPPSEVSPLKHSTKLVSAPPSAQQLLGYRNPLSDQPRVPDYILEVVPVANAKSLPGLAVYLAPTFPGPCPGYDNTTLAEVAADIALRAAAPAANRSLGSGNRRPARASRTHRKLNFTAPNGSPPALFVAFLSGGGATLLPRSFQSTATLK
ncbi:hypothetical protein C8R47DRAFT_1239120 [Mycena vitilis]|nr:hypothetical protein C8R47DRAFT_1239120 [Mycena vitilis]